MAYSSDSGVVLFSRVVRRLGKNIIDDIINSHVELFLVRVKH